MWTNRLVLASASVLLAAACSDSGSENASGTATGTAGPSGSGTLGTTGSGTTGSTTGATSATGGMTASTTGSTTGSGTTGSGTTGSGTTGSGTTGSGTTGSGGTGTTTSSSTGGTGGSGGVVATDTCPYTPPELPDTFPMGWTSDTVTVFNDNGGWTWYNDERVVVDAEAGKIVVGSASSSASSQSADTTIKVVIHDLASGMNQEASLGSLSYSDDHNNPGIVVKAPGEYFAAYAHHNQDCNTYWANYSGSWGMTTTHTWGEGCPWTNNQGGTSNVTYNNVWRLSTEGRIYNFIRSVETSPTFLYSENNGQSWEWGGRLTSSQQIGYNAGYYKYWGNGVDRIDFFATESHPRDSNTSIYHGYIQGEKSYDSFGEEQDANLFDGNSPTIQEFTQVFQAGNMLDGVAMNRLWNFDVARYADGTIGVLWQGREQANAQKPSNPSWDPGHHVAYSRFDGTEWKSTRLVRGGRTLYRQLAGDWWEEDYIGGAALDPDDPHVVYVSTNIDPRDDTTEYPWNEIWKGVSCDDGATFTWTPLTMNSPAENLRPAVPKWDTKNTAVLWFRGVYNTAQSYGTEVVGIVTRDE